MRELLLFVLFTSLGQLSAAPGYVGFKACSGCHKTQAEAHAKSGHATALWRAAEHPLAEKFANREDAWAFGAGGQAVTFVRQLDEETWVEEHLSWYRHSGGFALTPGHQTLGAEATRNSPGLKYPAFAPNAAILKCFRCHSTGPLSLGNQWQIQPAEAGVQCESCHGPGESHAARPVAGNIQNPAKLSPADRLDVCTACHRPVSSDLADVDWRDPWNTRHQPMFLTRSRCFLESGGALTCQSCHPAHQALSETKDASYQQVCRGCHAAQSAHPPAAVCGRSGESCTQCHMPAVRPREELVFHNHWIGVFVAGDTLMPRR